MEVIRFIRVFWNAFAELWLGIEKGNENPPHLAEVEENARHVESENMRGH